MDAFLAPDASRDLSVMSYNLRYPAKDRNPWPSRRGAAAALLREEAPHVIGTQEGVLEQLDSLVADLPERYVWLGEGRDGGNAGEFTAVIFDSDRLEPERVENFWLSEQPDKPGSVSWGSSHPRVTTMVDFRDRSTGHRLRFINTHFDHKSHEARLESVALIRDRAAAAPGASVVVGDFNVDQHNEVHSRLSSPPLRDAWEDGVRAGRSINTFHGYRTPKPDDRRIDWILASAGLAALRVGANEFSLGGQFPSDHTPVQAILRWLD